MLVDPQQVSSCCGSLMPSTCPGNNAIDQLTEGMPTLRVHDCTLSGKAESTSWHSIRQRIALAISCRSNRPPGLLRLIPSTILGVDDANSHCKKIQSSRVTELSARETS